MPTPKIWYTYGQMARPLTLFTGQWADLPLERVASLAHGFGYDGLELACWGDHFDVETALKDPGYIRRHRQLLDSYDLKCWALGAHLVGQAVCDPIDERHRQILPPEIWGDGDPERVRVRAADRLADTARAAAALGLDQVNGFTGSPVWHLLYSFPPNDFDAIDRGYQVFAERFGPILDVFRSEGVRFGLEVHPTEIAYDFVTARRTLAAVNGHDSFGFNLDPSHLVHQFLDPAEFAYEFGDRIYHVHVKDVKRRLMGRQSILGSHLQFGDPQRGWDFVSPGRGDVNFYELIRALNTIGYDGPLSVEWEDSAMDRQHGAAEAAKFVRAIDFPPAEVQFDAVMRGQSGRNLD